MSELDWNAEAGLMAEQVARDLPDRPRGVMTGRQARVSVVFGNEPGRDPEAVADEVARIRDSLAEEGIRVLGFAPPGDVGTWAMIVESEDLPLLDDILAGLAD